ncbi:MAG TPA: SymE family type I addiction module toxin [Thermoanaerobaculia bacterium]|jgi:hypothetical protein
MTKKQKDPVLDPRVRKLPVLSRPRVRRARKQLDVPTAPPKARPAPAARPPHVLTLAARRIERPDLPAAVVPYLRMSGRWLAEHGFQIGAAVRVVVEQGRVTLISDSGG